MRGSKGVGESESTGTPKAFSTLEWTNNLPVLGQSVRQNRWIWLNPNEQYQTIQGTSFYFGMSMQFTHERYNWRFPEDFELAMVLIYPCLDKAGPTVTATIIQLYGKWVTHELGAGWREGWHVIGRWNSISLGMPVGAGKCPLGGMPAISVW